MRAGHCEHVDLDLALALAAKRNSWYACNKGEGTVAGAEATGIWGVVAVKLTLDGAAVGAGGGPG